MILCHECRKPIEIPVEYGLRTPLRGKHLCDDCILLLDHFEIASAPAIEG